ncbi:hypothetical protein Psi01_05540 [Planobispora siamensis]|uniref:Uncharacterized protein n=1 Tax=Planobispora siamensis TaxID=936338 RepID=A0A8J3SAR8_9ACTN|nr:hypothetical protein Psi01_05540 [Planobispora siamensis]
MVSSDSEPETSGAGRRTIEGPQFVRPGGAHRTENRVSKRNSCLVRAVISAATAVGSYMLIKSGTDTPSLHIAFFVGGIGAIGFLLAAVWAEDD